MKRGYLFLGGEFELASRLKKLLKKPGIVVAADSGAKGALKFGKKLHHLVGDLDSISPRILKKIKGTKIHRYPLEKDLSDGELALKLLISQKPKEIFILGALGKRIDFTLANLFLLSKIPTTISSRILARKSEIFFQKKGRVILKGKKGDLVSLLSLEEKGAWVTTQGLYYRLKREHLHFGSHGISNRMTLPKASIQIHKGSVFIFH